MLQKEYNLTRRRYLKAFDNLLAVSRSNKVDLSKTQNTRVLFESLLFWDKRKLKSVAFSIMPNHVHWVLELLVRDADGNLVYLQDIMQSVKRFSAKEININESKSGTLWQKESFDTTIRDEKHFYNAVHYTLNNAVAAGFVKDWKDWPGNYLCSSYLQDF